MYSNAISVVAWTALQAGCEMAGASSLLQSGTHVGIVRADIWFLLSLILQFDRQQSVPVLYSRAASSEQSHRNVTTVDDAVSLLISW